MQIPKKKENPLLSPIRYLCISFVVIKVSLDGTVLFLGSPLSSLSIIVLIMMMIMRKKKDIHAVVMNFVVFVPSFGLQLLSLLFLQRLFLLLLLLSRLLRHSEQPVEEDGSKRVKNDVRPQEAKISPSIIVGNIDR